MQLNSKHLHREIINKAKDNRHILMGYMFLALVFVGAVSSVYYWEYKVKIGRTGYLDDTRVESGEQVNYSNDCPSNPMMAMNRTTGEVREFPTVCHITEHWELVQ